MATSIGITLEHQPGQGYDQQIGPLGWLIRTLTEQHTLPHDAVVLWSRFAGHALTEVSLEDLSLAEVMG